MTNTTRLGSRQIDILNTLEADGPADSILALEPAADFVHTWHYRAVHSLAKRGLVNLTPSGIGNRIGVEITAAGSNAIA